MFQFGQEKEDVQRVIQPLYYRAFACDSSRCGSLCCRENWHVVVDDDTLARYRNAGGKLGEELRRGVVRVGGTGIWAMRHQKGVCTFLRADGLCSLHRRFGSVALSDVCAEYPRKTHVFETQVFRGLCMTCPVAAETALLPREPMRFEEVQAELSRPKYYEKGDASPLGETTFFAVRRIAIAILQERSASLNHRLAALGILLSEVETRAGKGGTANLEADGAAFAAAALRAVPALLEDAPFDAAQGLPFFRQLIPYVTAACEDTLPETREAIAHLTAAFGHGHASEAFSDRLAKYREHVLAPYAYMLENYFVNAFYLERYPLMGGTSLILNYQVFVVLAKLTEFLVLADDRLMEEPAQAADGSGIAPVQQAILDAARWISIHTNHSTAFIHALYAYMKEQQVDISFFEMTLF